MALAADDSLHVVILPWSAFGHLIPYYHLSISLAKKGVRVSYVSTPKNIERLPKIPSNLAPFMQYVSLPLPVIPGSNLPKDAEANVDVDFEQLVYLKLAYNLLREPFKKFVISESPDWIISDANAQWMPEISRECHVPLMFFASFSAIVSCFMGPPEYLKGEGQKRVRPTPDSLTTPPPWGTFPPSFALRGYEAVGFHAGVYSKNATGITEGERIANILEGCQAVAVRTCREFDGEYIDLYQTLLKKPVLPTGLLPPADPVEEENENTSATWSEAFKWLDKQSSRSIIYVGFGSEYKFTKDELHEIAYGLELAQLPFIWALRRPTWAADDSEALPPGFMSRTSGKGIVCFGWAPQLKVLAHPSVGGALFHCGWGSTIETLKNGLSLILLPFIIEQGLNARIMVEKGLGIEVVRREDGSYTRDDIADALRRAMVGDEAERIQANARQAAKYFGDEELHQEHYIGALVEYLRNERCTSMDKQ